MTHPGQQLLPEIALRFAGQSAGLIVFAGGPKSGKTTAATALAEHVRSTTERAISGPGPGVASLAMGEGHSDRPGVLLLDTTMTVDGLAAAIEAAAAGDLVIVTMTGDRAVYSGLLDCVQAAEDWSGKLRRDFDAALYAIIHQSISNGVPAVEVVHTHPAVREA